MKRISRLIAILLIFAVLLTGMQFSFVNAESTGDLQGFYNVCVQAINNKATDVSYTLNYNASDADVESTIDRILNENPQYSYFVKNISSSFKSTGSQKKVALNFEYSTDNLQGPMWKITALTHIQKAVFMVFNSRAKATILYFDSAMLKDFSSDVVKLEVESMTSLFKEGAIDDANGFNIINIKSYYKTLPTFSNSDSGLFIALEVTYCESLDEKVIVQKLLRDESRKILEDASTFKEKVTAVNKFIVANHKYYNSNDDKTYTAYGFLTRKYGACQAYSLTTGMLLQYVGIDSRIISGRTERADHDWNIVKSKDSFYHLDTTFNDPTPDVEDRVKTTYSLITDETMRNDHYWNSQNYTTTRNNSYIQDTKSLYNQVIKIVINSSVMSADGIKMEVDTGRTTTPIIRNSRTLVPLRSIVEALGGAIYWDEPTQCVTIYLSGNVMKLYINKNSATYNDNPITLEVAPTIINGRTMLPARAVFESFGATIGWDNVAREVTISYNGY